ncbi:MAG: hypothetical protein GWN99_08800 [Gemmatimonadetes bacterium]|uniref:Glycosyltransferase RgtA/B/C/D-like domain-containing protein n=1 Tax=Candidatus Kutchimonas denitrificans TaxID=3056748 RepID=A0AAE4ZCC3_9BACT|nr:hypothetical protein [Gemmatimonadota bacterium]NIR76596.1 hypothetical protein [Candidatus Kutchimonas denitrificans]NIS01152.1 hypothetical protein [Gemmatimonadota bacterium]NIT66919.1 hypothetical protein [Gemmatimonadota bacterium]NIU54692.1 hypothetical protein [Gemmatimonadota bacterium]
MDVTASERSPLGPGNRLGRRTTNVLLALGFVLIALATYHRTLGVPLSSDAQYLTYLNRYNREVSGLAEVWTADYFAGSITFGVPANSGYYRPIANTYFWFAYQLAGRNDVIYNLLEVILHGLNGFLVFLVCRRLSREFIAAGVAGLFFVLHPVHAFAAVEPAAAADVLFPIFYLLAMLAFDSAVRDADSRAAAGKLGLTTVLYLLALLTKEMAATLPAALVLLATYRHFTHGVAWRRLAWTLPVWLAFGAYLLLRFVIVDVPTQLVGYREVHPTLVLAIGAVKGIVIHFSRLLLPLGADYPELNPWLINFVGNIYTDPVTYVALAVVLALGMLALAYRWNPYIAFWSGFFLVTYSPLMRVDSIAGSLGHDMLLTEERWIYLPSIAVAAVIGYGVARAADRVRGRAARFGLVGLVAAALLFFAGSAMSHAGRHEDPHARLRQLYLFPEEELHPMQRANKLMLYAEWVAAPSGDMEEAERRARAAYAEVPDSPITAGALAVMLARRGKWREVIQVLGPWHNPGPAFMAEMKETNFRVGDDLNRVATLIPVVLARAYAHLGAGRAAAGLLCEAVMREFDPQLIHGYLGENWALNGPAACRTARDPDACAAGVTLPPGSGWEPPYDPQSCPTWPKRWDELVSGG